MIKIKRERTHFTIDLKCNHCLKDFQNDDEFYYCSLCNYCICKTCFDKSNEKFWDNIQYL